MNRRMTIRMAPLAAILLACGCTSLGEFVQNGFKVGPNYERPPAPLASEWIEAKNPHVKMAPGTTAPGGESSAIRFWTI
jgi:hypothetical protein